jgi:hypothetical protein
LRGRGNHPRRHEWAYLAAAVRTDEVVWVVRLRRRSRLAFD